MVFSACTETQSEQVTFHRNCEKDFANGELTKLERYLDRRRRNHKIFVAFSFRELGEPENYNFNY